MAAVYNPIMNELFFAEKGKGATLNDKKIKVSKKQQCAECLSGNRFSLYLPGYAKWTIANI